MEDIFKRIALALVLSMVLPNLILNTGSRMMAHTAAQTEPTAAATQPSTQPTQYEAAVRITIPVYIDGDSVKMMDLETYVRGVVLAEMPASFETEALKAQAVAARTYALRRLYLGDKHRDCAVCTQSSCCQAWMSDEAYRQLRGTETDWRKVADAVVSTAGRILTYEGDPAECTYYSCSGGRTESAEAVWGVEIPYLVSVESSGEEWAAAFSAEVFFSADQFAVCLGRELSGKPYEWLGEVTYTEGGGVQSMTVAGISYSGRELRTLLGLNSTAFTMTADENGIRIATLGKGHRVGLSQYGANAMAREGADWVQILRHYYPGTVIDKIDALG